MYFHNFVVVKKPAECYRRTNTILDAMMISMVSQYNRQKRKQFVMVFCSIAHHLYFKKTRRMHICAIKYQCLSLFCL